MSFFTITHKEKNTGARTGVLHTAHGDVETPTFMPVGTQATVKTLDAADLTSLEAQIILANTYHLHLRPGEDVIANFGGLHEFMKWRGPILTDSGGFQVFSLGKQKRGKEQRESSPVDGELAIGQRGSSPDQGKLATIDNDGVTFRSHIDGSTHRFTPERAIDIEHKLGADIIMAFDECTRDDVTLRDATDAMERTHAWAARSLEAHQKNTQFHGYPQYLFGIIQGANHKELREASARTIAGMGFDGIAIGGESVGYNMDATKNILEWVMPLIPEKVPHYTMGVGHSLYDIFEVVERGVDMFDCVSPTRMARNGSLFVHPETMKELDGKNLRMTITNAQFTEDKNPIDPRCTCVVCCIYSRAYLHHLFIAQELLAYRLATLHNLSFLLSLMKNIREAIRTDVFLELKQKWVGP